MFLKYVFLILFAFVTNLSAHDTKKKSIKAHEHGAGTLNIVQEGNTLLFEFEMPGNDIVGFEYKAVTSQDVKKVENAINILTDYKNMIKPSGSADCSIMDSSAKVIYEGKHSEFLSEYTFKCSKISDLKIIYLSNFKNFVNNKKLNIKIIGNNKKTAYVIDKSKKIINVKGFF